MPELRFDCIEARPDRYAAAPTMLFRLRVAELSGAAVAAVALRCQFRIEPQRRRYSPAEAARLVDLFGEPERWGQTLKPMQLATVPVLLPAFTGSTEVDVPLPCTYDFEVATAKYLHALDDGTAPLLLLFSGTVFTKGPTGLVVEPLSWSSECIFGLPAAAWKELMDIYFPGTAWIRIRRETLDALQRFKSEQALPTWDDSLELLLKSKDDST